MLEIACIFLNKLSIETKMQNCEFVTKRTATALQNLLMFCQHISAPDSCLCQTDVCSLHDITVESSKLT